MKHCILLSAIIIAVPVLAFGQFGMAGPEVSYEALSKKDAYQPGETAHLAIRVKLEAGWHVNAHEPLDDLTIPTVLDFEESGAAAFEAAAYPEHEIFHFEFSPDPVAVYGEIFVIGAAFSVAEDAAPGSYSLNGTLRYQACNDKLCAPPKNLEVTLPLEVSADGGAVNQAHEAVFSAIAWPEAGPADSGSEAGPETTEPDAEGQPHGSAESGPPPGNAQAAGPQDWKPLAADFEEVSRLNGFASTKDFLAYVEAAKRGEEIENFLTGKSWYLVAFLILLGGLALNLTPCVLPLIPINVGIIGAGARAGSRVRGFGLGLSYGVAISAVYGLLGLAVVLGVSSAFGAINSTVWFNAAIAVVFVLLGLAMFDIIHIDFSKYQAKVGIRKNEHGSFAVAFFMGGVSALLAGACVAPVVIYTILYAQDLYSQGYALALLLPFLLGVGMALPWPFLGMGLSFMPKPGKWMNYMKYAFGVFIIAFALYYGYEAYSLASGPDAHDVQEEAGWITSIEEGLAQAKEEGKPVIIDFWATWCKNCLVMGKTTLVDEEVVAALDDFVKIKYQAEDIESNEVTRHYQVLGLPTFIVLEPKQAAR